MLAPPAEPADGDDGEGDALGDHRQEHRGARWIPVVIVALSAQMVGVILLARDLARGPRAAVFLAMVAEGVAFAVVTVRWLRRRR